MAGAFRLHENNSAETQIKNIGRQDFARIELTQLDESVGMLAYTFEPPRIRNVAGDLICSYRVSDEHTKGQKGTCETRGVGSYQEAPQGHPGYRASIRGRICGL